MNLLREIANITPDLGDVEEPINDSPKEKILDIIFNVPTGKDRGILMMSLNDLKSVYLTAGGPKKFVDALTDEQLGDMASDNTFFKVTGNKFELSMVTGLLQAELDVAVLLNIDSSLIQQLTEEEGTGHEEVRDFLREALSHAFYIGALRAKAISSAGINSREEFDVKKFIAAFPDRQLITAAREET